MERRDYYVGKPSHPDSTTRAVFGDPALKPVEDWGWLPQARRPHTGPEDKLPLPTNQYTAIARRRQIAPDLPAEKDPPTETARRLTEIQAQFTTMRASLGRKFRNSDSARDLKEEYQQLMGRRRREKIEEKGRR